jgi:hypothetical protein
MSKALYTAVLAFLVCGVVTGPANCQLVNRPDSDPAKLQPTYTPAANSVKLNPAWVSKQFLSVQMTSDPDASLNTIFFAGANHHLWKVQLDGSGLEDLGGVALTSAPAPIRSVLPDVYTAPTQYWIFYRGPNYHLWVSTHDGQPAIWSAPQDLGGVSLRSNPTAFWIGESSNEKKFNVFYAGPNLHLWTNSYVGGPDGWRGPEDLGGVELTSDPFVVACRERDGYHNGMCVFYRGPNHHLWKNQWQHDLGWSAPEDLGGVVLSGAPTAFNPGSQIEVYYPAANGELIWSQWGSTWSAPFDLGVKISTRPSAANQSQVFYQGTDGTLWTAQEPAPVYAPPSQAGITFTAAPNNGYINVGQAATLTWTVHNCGSNCKAHMEGKVGLNYADVGFEANVLPTGSMTVHPTSTQTKYTITSSGSGGGASANLVVTLAPSSAPPNGQTFYFKLTNAQSTILPCFADAVIANSQAMAEQLLKNAWGGYAITPITAQEMTSACPAPF